MLARSTARVPRTPQRLPSLPARGCRKPWAHRICAAAPRHRELGVRAAEAHAWQLSQRRGALATGRAAWARAEAATRGMHGALQLRAHSAQYGAPALARAVAAAQRLMALRFEAERSRSSAAWRKRAAEAAEVVEEEESSAEGGGARGGARSAASGGEQALVARLDALRAELGGSLRLAETAPAPSQRGLSGAAETSQPRVPSGGKDPSPGAPKGMAVVGGRAQLAWLGGLRAQLGAGADDAAPAPAGAGAGAAPEGAGAAPAGGKGSLRRESGKRRRPRQQRAPRR